MYHMKQLSFSRRFWFTLVEMLVAITILWILSTIWFISFTKYNVQARDVVRITDIKNIIKVLWLHNLKTGLYPNASNAVDVTYSGAVVWSQWSFWDESIAETGKIFGELRDPKYDNKYSYSVTLNKKEYQIAAYFESEEQSSNLFTFSGDAFSFSTAYAADDFTPLGLNPKIWLDATDIDGDWNVGNNPSNGDNISAWVNKSSQWSSHDPVLTHGNIRYAENGYQSLDISGYLPWVFIANNRWVRLENSEITNGSIFYVVQKRDPFANTDSTGLGIYGVNNSNYYFWYDTNKRKNTVRLGSSPNKSGTTGSRTSPFIYQLLINSSSYEFYDTWSSIYNGLTNGANSVVWGFNRAWSSSKRSDLIISEILIFDYSLSIDERHMVEWYLAHKWEQVSYLPGDHPYKTIPPENITPPTPDSTPDAFIIDDVTGADPSIDYISNPFTLAGINQGVGIQLSDGEYSINGWSYTSWSWTVAQWDIIRVRLTSSATSLDSVSSMITIGGVVGNFMVTTKSIDNTPDSFGFSPLLNAETNISYASSTNQITGINIPLAISISGTWAEYKITDGIPVDVTGNGVASGVARNGSNLTSYAFDDNLSSWWGSPSNSFPISLDYDLGTGNAERINAYTFYRSSNQNGWNNNKYSPSDWQFQASNNGTTWVTLDTQSNQTVYTNASAKSYEFTNSQFFRYYRISIIDAVNSNRVNISEISLLNLWDGVFTSSPWTITESDYVVVKSFSPSEYATSSEAVLHIWSATGSFVITTVVPPADYDPDVFSFTDVSEASPSTEYISNSINITWITADTSIAITGGEYEINNSWTWSSTSSSNGVSANDSISIRWVSPSGGGNTTSVTLTVWSESATYSITTELDGVPDTLNFAKKTLVEVDTIILSDSATISWINVQIPITSISWGEYSINGWTWSSSNDQLENNDTLILRLDSSTSFNATSSMSLNIAGIPYIFEVSTELADITPNIFTFVDLTEADLSFLHISESIQISDINSPTAISISNGEYRIWNGSFTSDPWFIENGNTVAIRLMSANVPEQITMSQLTIGWVSDYFEIETKEVTVLWIKYEKPQSNVYVWGNFNGLITYAYTGSTHYVLTTPSILAYDLSSTNLVDILAQKKLVYNGFENIPETYQNSGLTMSGWFEFSLNSPVVFEGTKEDLWSYSGLKEIDEWVREIYNNFLWYAYIAKYLDTFSLNYLEDILGNSIGINPIKPYYCSDILRTKLVYNVAKTAHVVADAPETVWMEQWINNGEISAELWMDPEYISKDGNAGIDFSWNIPQKIGYIRIYNTVNWNSQDLSDAVVTFYNAFGWVIDTYNIGFDTSGDYIIDLDFESIGKIYHAQKVRIQTTGGKKLSIREIEIYLWGSLESGEYKVDKDGLWGLSPYNVYCDMETDGGGWTRIWENYISNWKFLKGVHTWEYTNLEPLQNVIVDGTVKVPPVYAADSYVLRHQWSINQYYELLFDNIPWKYYAQEIRLWAWVDGTDASIFWYELDYETDANVSEIAEFEILQTDGTWNYVQARIPLSDVVASFRWKLADEIAGPIFITDLNMEVYYK